KRGVAVPPEVREGMKVWGPSPQDARVAEERRNPRALAQAITLELAVESKHSDAIFARACATVVEGEQQGLVELDVRIAVQPQQRTIHIEFCTAPIPSVKPAGKG